MCVDNYYDAMRFPQGSVGKMGVANNTAIAVRGRAQTPVRRPGSLLTTLYTHEHSDRMNNEVMSQDGRRITV